MLGGVVASACFRFRAGKGGSGVAVLLKADDGTIRQLRVFGCSTTDEGELQEGRRLVLLHVWLVRAGDGWPVLRVDGGLETVHLDLRADGERSMD